MTDEEKAAKKEAATAAKRAATAGIRRRSCGGGRQACGNHRSDGPGRPAVVISGRDSGPVTEPVAQIIEAVAGPPLDPPLFQAELVEEAVSDSDSDDDMEVPKKFVHDGVTYLKTCVDECEDVWCGALRCPSTNLPVGVWDAELKKIGAYDASKYE